MNRPNLVLIQNEKSIIIQRRPYIEDGCYIELIGNEITIWEIPSGGGEPVFHSRYPNLPSALLAFNYLT